MAVATEKRTVKPSELLDAIAELQQIYQANDSAGSISADRLTRLARLLYLAGSLHQWQLDNLITQAELLEAAGGDQRTYPATEWTLNRRREVALMAKALKGLVAWSDDGIGYSRSTAAA